ncbi:hypothetical protein [Alteromonas oceani]|nr:hypothetical protein [Alteromonas oceani]
MSNTPLQNADNLHIYFNINMRLNKSANPVHRGREKKKLALLLAARYGFVSAITCQAIWQIRRHKVLESLNRIVKEGLLTIATTDRAADGRIYVLTHSGAQFAAELMRVDIPFRSAREPITQVNQNAIMHDSILSFVLSQGLQNKTKDGIPKPLWSAYLTEIEFKRIHSSSAVKNVDALVQLDNGEVAALELEASFKRKTQHEKTILKLRDAMLGENKLYDKVFIIPCSQKINNDTQRYYKQLLEEMPCRYDRKTKLPLLSNDDADRLREKIIFRTKFIEPIEQTFYR